MTALRIETSTPENAPVLRDPIAPGVAEGETRRVIDTRNARCYQRRNPEAAPSQSGPLPCNFETGTGPRTARLPCQPGKAAQVGDRRRRHPFSKMKT